MLKKIKNFVNTVLNEVLGANDRCVHRVPSTQECQRCRALLFTPFGGKGP